MITLLVFTDGRPHVLQQTLASAAEHLHGPITERVIVDDSGSNERRAALATMYPDYRVISWGERKGFAGTIAAAWRGITMTPEADPFIFHLEDDFTFERDVDLDEMATVLQHRPELAQMALRRQPVNDVEIAAGGIVEQWPGEYEDKWQHLPIDRTEVGPDTNLVAWLEHRLFWTTNPSLYRSSTCALGWPEQPRSEAAFTAQLLEDPAVRFGYWGARSDQPWVRHIGARRAGTGY